MPFDDLKSQAEIDAEQTLLTWWRIVTVWLPILVCFAFFAAAMAETVWTKHNAERVSNE